MLCATASLARPHGFNTARSAQSAGPPGNDADQRLQGRETRIAEDADVRRTDRRLSLHRVNVDPNDFELRIAALSDARARRGHAADPDQHLILRQKTTTDDPSAASDRTHAPSAYDAATGAGMIYRAFRRSASSTNLCAGIDGAAAYIDHGEFGIRDEARGMFDVAQIRLHRSTSGRHRRAGLRRLPATP